MKRTGRFAYLLVLSLMVALSGCESIALMPRPDVDRRDGDQPDLSRRDPDRSEVGRSPEARGEIRDRDITGPRDEVVGTVERIDT
ncbi:MAG TPA: hypothetical protein VE616_15635, partial [Candidatus Udaeobacter sp.]|nr:hypothetical protein [Candidatus Udaeobacter sp.]